MAEDEALEVGRPCRAISFLARVRSGGGSGSSIQVTIPKDVVEYLELTNGNFVRVAVHKLNKPNKP